MVLVIIVFVINLVITWANAYCGGKNLHMARRVGGFAWLLNWSGIIMAGCGFTWCYTLLIAGLGYCFNQLTIEQTMLCVNAGYVILAPVVIGTGFVITVHSWKEFLRRRTVGSGLEVAWNTYAQIHNTSQAISFFPEAVTNVIDAVGDDDSDVKTKASIVAIMLAVAALLLGVLTTRYIVVRAASTVV